MRVTSVENFLAPPLFARGLIQRVITNKYVRWVIYGMGQTIVMIYIQTWIGGNHRYLYELHGSSTSYNRIIHQQHVLVLELTLDCVQLQTHCFPSHFLSGHDERPCNVSILNEPFAIRRLRVWTH